MYTSSYDGSKFLRMLTGLTLDEYNNERIELGVLDIINLLGMLSNGVKKLIEKRKAQQAIQIVNILPITSMMPVSMTTLLEHSGAQPRECSFMPKKLMSINNFLIGLVLGCVRYNKNRAHF